MKLNTQKLRTSSLKFDSDVAGRENHMPWLLSMVNPYRETPIPAVLFTVCWFSITSCFQIKLHRRNFQGLISLLYLILSDNVYTLINYVQIVNWLAIGIATTGLFWLRRKMPPGKPEFKRPLQVNITNSVLE